MAHSSLSFQRTEYLILIFTLGYWVFSTTGLLSVVYLQRSYNVGARDATNNTVASLAIHLFFVIKISDTDNKGIVMKEQ